MWTHDRRHSEGKTTGGMWCAGMRQSDAELSARRHHFLSDATHHSQVYTWSLLHCTFFKSKISIKQYFLNRIIAASLIKKHYNKNKIYIYLTSTASRLKNIDYSKLFFYIYIYIYILLYNLLHDFSNTLWWLRIQQHILERAWRLEGGQWGKQLETMQRTVTQRHVWSAFSSAVCLCFHLLMLLPLT